MITAGWSEFKMAYEITPIILTGGIATGQGSGLPIIALIAPPGEDDDPDQPIANSNISPELDGYIFRFSPMSGSTLIKNEVATYPFANQTVAANAMISDANVISLMMYCPATGDNPYKVKQNVLVSLVASLRQHTLQGGTYTVNTPAQPYPGCLLLSIIDISGGEGNQYQYKYQWNFYQPLTTLDQAAQAQSGMMQTLTNQTQPAGTPGWSPNPVQNPSQTFTQSLVPPPINDDGD